MKKLIPYIVLLCINIYAIGQSFRDTVSLPAIEIKAKKEIFDMNVGSRISVISESVMELNQTQSLAELINNNSTINIKSLGQGGLSTSSFRGTSSSHTKVNWNGININSSSVGNFDFSQVPTFFTEEVALFHGSGYINNGSGSLGGSININNSIKELDKPFELKILSEYGSNNTFTEGISLKYKIKKLNLSTKVYYQQSENNFKYINNVFGKEQFYERRENASYQKFGAMQELHCSIDKNSYLSANIWYSKDKRELPQAIIVYAKSKEKQDNDNIRSIIKYNFNKGKSSFEASFAYLLDLLEYQRRFDISLGDISTKNVNHSIVTKLDYKYFLCKKIRLSAVVNNRYDAIISENYISKYVGRNIFSTMLSASYKPFKEFTIDAQIMGENALNKAILTYSLGISYPIIKNILSIKASNAYNFRQPTLNDLYWTPGGNPDLNPEQGFSYDATIAFTPSIKSTHLKFEATYYRMDIQNWIMWIPTSNSAIWSPVNFNDVLSQGVEVLSEVSFEISNTKNKIILNYTYSPSIDQSDRKDNTYARQLPYIPKNKWNARYMIYWKNLTFSYNVGFTDIRYTSADESYFTNAYIIHDADLGYLFKFKHTRSLKTSLKLNNIFDTYYESTQYYPMPLRAIYFSVLLTI